MSEHATPIDAPAAAGPVDLARLEALAEKARPGPWEADGSELYVAGQWDDDGTRSWVGETCAGSPTDDSNAEFIAELRNAAPSLLAAARAVRRVRDALGRFEQRAVHCEVVAAVRAALGGETG